eukprot:scaffold27556_cov84-Attheya_sp.AAC.1
MIRVGYGVSGLTHSPAFGSPVVLLTSPGTIPKVMESERWGVGLTRSRSHQSVPHKQKGRPRKRSHHRVPIPTVA